MSKYRMDGSVESSNVPSRENLYAPQTELELGIYRCMITEVRYTDSPYNITFKNPQVTYEAVILGGPKEGQILTNIVAMHSLGGEYNYEERIYRKLENPLAGEKSGRIYEQKGDIVYVGFIQANKSTPVILGCGTQPLDEDNTGARSDEGPRLLEEYNGVLKYINRDGELSFVRKGGSLNEASGVFEPGEERVSTFFMDKNGGLTLNANDGSFLGLNAAAGEVTLSQKDGNALALLQDQINIAHKSGSDLISIGEDLLQITTNGDLVQQSNAHTIDSGSINMAGRGSASIGDQISKLVIENGLIGLGSPAAELLDLFDKTLDEIVNLTTAMATETHIGNLGYSTAPPINSANYLAVQAKITVIKTLLATIKGSV